MAEPINLDELLSKDEPIETTEETTAASDETSTADDSTEDQGVDVSNEDNEPQNV
jgi:hypothetical protein